MEGELSYKLESFEGPLDLLLQLISRNKLNIYDIKLSVLIEQYLKQMEVLIMILSKYRLNIRLQTKQMQSLFVEQQVRHHAFHMKNI